MLEIVANVKNDFDKALAAVKTQDELEALRVQFLGKKVAVTEVLKGLKDMDVETKKQVGQEMNILKNEIDTAIREYGAKLEEEAFRIKMEQAEKFDFTIPSDDAEGSLHPITIVQRQIEDIFKSMGFIIEDGLEIQTEYNNFESVNIPKHHPARDMQDTYYLSNGQLLKTHTSAAQNYIMRK